MCDRDSLCVIYDAALPLLPQGPPGLKGEQGDTVVIDYDGRILDALKVRAGSGCTLYGHPLRSNGSLCVLLLGPSRV